MHYAFCVLQSTPAQDAMICTLEAFSFQHLPSLAPTAPPFPCLRPPTQTHRNRNSKIHFKDISKVQMEKC